jgi:small subunit ribosomal protein S4
MGDIKRRRQKYSRPRKMYDKARIEAENKIVERYGLKNKTEIWKADSAVSAMRRRAKLLIPKSDEEKKVFFDKLNKMGLNVQSIADVLALTKENLLERRLQTFIFRKGFAKTPKQARQLITHKHVFVNGKITSAPSFNVSVDVEGKISLKERKAKIEKEAVSVEPTVSEETEGVKNG